MQTALNHHLASKPSVTLIKGELFKQGGLEKYTWQIAMDFCTLGCHVTILTSGSVRSPFSHPLLKIVSLPISHSLSFFNVIHFDRACSRYLSEHLTPIIFSLDRNRFQTHIRAGNGVHAAYLQQRCLEEGFVKKLSFAINPLHQAILSLEKKAFEHPDLKILFTNSQMVKNEISQFYCTDPDKIQVVHNGVEWYAMQETFDHWESKRETTLRQLKLDPLSFQFLFIGHNYLRKGLDKLLSAFAHIRNHPFQLSVIGKDKHVSYFEQLAQNHGLSQKVFFFGPQQQTSHFYQMADCLIVPSLYDPFANVTLEALAMGLLVISSQFNGGHEILSPQNGFVLETLEDPVYFSKILEKALEFRKTPERAHAIRQSVRHFDFSNQLRRMTEMTIDTTERVLLNKNFC